MNWDTLTIDTYTKVYQQTSNAFLPEEEKILRTAAVIGGITYEELLEQPIDRTREMVADSAFLYVRPEAGKARKSYTLNGREYTLIKDPSEMTTAQYIDYQNVVGEKFEEHLLQLLSIILVPKGHTYNDGYDTETVLKDLGTMTVTDALGITDFFLKRYRRLLRRSLLYCEAAMTVSRIRAPRELKKVIREMEKEMNAEAQRLRSSLGSLSLKQLLR